MTVLDIKYVSLEVILRIVLDIKYISLKVGLTLKITVLDIKYVLLKLGNKYNIYYNLKTLSFITFCPL